ncbi:MAG: LPS export ABC transporter permease LptG [Deltaproteobacteria bacterium]|nr:MAG: LPS export ABC transporter permease LptG [Deltaproteobacteria bacterium]
MRILDRYLHRIFWRMFALTAGAFTGVYLLIEFFERVDDFLEHKAVATQYLRYFGWKLPVILVDIMPLAVLLSVFLTLGSLSRHGELTAMRACGLGLARISRPLIAGALLLSIGHFYLSDRLVPHGAAETRRILKHELVGRPELARKQEQVWFREGDAIVFTRLLLPQQGQLQDITIYEVDRNFRLQRRIDAAHAVWQKNGTWLLQEAVVRQFRPDGQPGNELRKQALSYQLNKSPADFAANQLDNRELPFAELLSLARRLSAEGYDTTRIRVDLQQRIAYSVTCLLMALLGIPFALQRGRGSNLALGVTISVAIGMVYFLLQSTMTAFGYAGSLPPWLAAWSGNILALLLALWMILGREA